jgi:hypothetical protein
VHDPRLPDLAERAIRAPDKRRRVIRSLVRTCMRTSKRAANPLDPHGVHPLLRARLLCARRLEHSETIERGAQTWAGADDHIGPAAVGHQRILSMPRACQSRRRRSGGWLVDLFHRCPRFPQSRSCVARPPRLRRRSVWWASVCPMPPSVCAGNGSVACGGRCHGCRTAHIPPQIARLACLPRSAAQSCSSHILRLKLMPACSTALESGVRVTMSTVGPSWTIAAAASGSTRVKTPGWLDG